MCNIIFDPLSFSYSFYCNANCFSCPMIWIKGFFLKQNKTKEKKNVKPQLKLMTSVLLPNPEDKWPYVLTWNDCGNPRKHSAHLIIIFRLVMKQKLVSSWVGIFLNKLNKTAWEESFNQNNFWGYRTEVLCELPSRTGFQTECINPVSFQQRHSYTGRRIDAWSSVKLGFRSAAEWSHHLQIKFTSWLLGS